MAAPLAIAFLVDSVPFTLDVINGVASLGGSESACLGLARALKALGHDPHIFATNLSQDAYGRDQAGVMWHPAEHFDSSQGMSDWDVVCALRQPFAYARPVKARWRMLWNQDLLSPQAAPGIMAIAWALDEVAYVSDYHRQQWELVEPQLAPLAWVTKNGYDPSLVTKGIEKHPNRIIHISRPERGLGPLMAMWKTLKARVPDAELHVCRYASMYDGEGSNVRAMCESFDQQLQALEQEVGGITMLGGLGKAELYKAIAEAAVMWYPGVVDFAETSCIAAIEAQANGTPFVGSWKGALPETIPSGILIPGDAMSPAYQERSIEEVVTLLSGCRNQTFAYRALQRKGRDHVTAYTYAAIAAEWVDHLERRFAERHCAHTRAVLRQLEHDDDYVAVKAMAERWRDSIVSDGDAPLGASALEQELAAVRDLADRVIAGKEQTADAYAAHAIQDPILEAEHSKRYPAVIPRFAGCTRVLDAACGNGSFAIALAKANPDVHICGVDYAEGNISLARAAAQQAGVGDRCHFFAAAVWDFDRQAPPLDGLMSLQEREAEFVPFDGLFCGEFLEHVANCSGLIDWLETFLAPGAKVVYTCPSGPFRELLWRQQPDQKGHVHCFTQQDMEAIFKPKLEAAFDWLEMGVTARGNAIGHWLMRYTVAPNRPAGHRDVQTKIARCRPMSTLSVGIIAHNAETDLARCLASVWAIADEIVVGDTGSTDTTAAIAAEWGATVIPLPRVEEIEEGFAGARNAVLEACTGDWFLWIDADEILYQGVHLRHYLQGALYHGFVINQNHVAIDAPPHYDIPTRLFRRRPDIRFYGCIHEQPQMGDCNSDVFPCLHQESTHIIHTGYLTSDIREAKRTTRNMALLRRDLVVFEQRLLGRVLLLREVVLQAEQQMVQHGGLTPLAVDELQYAIETFRQYFADPAHKFHAIARPFYQSALRHLGLGFEMEIGLGGKRGGISPGGRTELERVWVADGEEFERLMAYKTAKVCEAMAPASLPHCDPFLPEPAREEVPA